MDGLARTVRDELEALLGTSFAGYIVAEIREHDHPWLITHFRVYDYWRASFTYDRGAFGFQIDTGSGAVPVLLSNEAPAQMALDAFVAEFDRRVRLRIPDKYLEWYLGDERRTFTLGSG